MAVARIEDVSQARADDPGEAAPAVSRMMLIDDDLISREILAMLAIESGFSVDAFESGEAAVHWLATSGSPAPEAILTDLQMPGLSGIALAKALRQACPPGTPLVVMSGSPAADPTVARAFDAFLLKPFSIQTLDRTFAAVMAETPPPFANGASAGIQSAEDDKFFEHLDRKTYNSLSRSMPADNLSALLTMCLDDSQKRIATMQQAAAAADETAYTRAAHAIKGGCATVGFRQLSALAARMEQDGLGLAGLKSAEQGRPEVDESSTPPQVIADFLAAADRLRVILITHGDRAHSPSG